MVSINEFGELWNTTSGKKWDSALEYPKSKSNVSRHRYRKLIFWIVYIFLAVLALGNKIMGELPSR